MEEKKQKVLLICLEVISLAILMPIFYCSTVKLLLGPIEDAFYPHMPYQQRIVSTLVVAFAILAFDAMWIILMKLCPQDKIHVKVVLTLLVLTFSAAVLSCFIIVDALTKAFA